MEEPIKKDNPLEKDPSHSKPDEELGQTERQPKDEIDKDSADLIITYLSNLKLNDQQKKEVKNLFTTELNSSVESLKSEIKKESQETKKDFLIIFGLFTSFVAFLSIEVQVFKNKDNVFEIIGISTISLSLIIFFALIITSIAKEKGEWKDFIKPAYIINFVFTIIGVVFLYFGGKSSISRIDIIEKTGVKNNTQIESLILETSKNTDSLKTLDNLRHEITSINTQLKSLDSLFTSYSKRSFHKIVPNSGNPKIVFEKY